MQDTFYGTIRSILAKKPEPFELDAKYFPMTTKDVFTLEEMKRLGVLALGFKNVSRLFRTERQLNVGFVNPYNESIRNEVMKIVRTRFESQAEMQIQSFQISREQFEEILEKVYGYQP